MVSRKGTMRARICVQYIGNPCVHMFQERASTLSGLHVFEFRASPDNSYPWVSRTDLSEVCSCEHTYI